MNAVKQKNSPTITYTYYDNSLYYERNGDSYEIYYTYDLNGTPVLASKRDLVEKKNYQLYLITNTRGDVIEMRDGSGNVRGKNIYDSWGKVIAVVDQNGNTLGSDTFQYQISLKYRGYVYDYETGLYYLQSRYYDPETGRFLNADSVDYIGATGTDLSYNLFAYCENDPVNGYDPTGNKRIEFSAKWIEAAIEIALTILFPTFKWKFDIVGNFIERVFEDYIEKYIQKFILKYGVGLLKKYGYINIAKYLLNTAIPAFKGLFSKGFTMIRYAIWRITGAILSWDFYYRLTKIYDKLVNGMMTFILKHAYNVKDPKNDSYFWYNLYELITTITSIGGIIGLTLDLFTDGEINEKVVFYI